MLIIGDTAFDVAEDIPSGAACGITDGKLVKRTRDHVLVGYAAEDLAAGDPAIMDRNMMIRHRGQRLKLET